MIRCELKEEPRTEEVLELYDLNIRATFFSSNHKNNIVPRSLVTWIHSLMRLNEAQNRESELDGNIGQLQQNYPATQCVHSLPLHTLHTQASQLPVSAVEGLMGRK